MAKKSPALAGLFFILLLGACQGQKTPEQVTLQFWQAMAENDLASAKQWVSQESRDLLQAPEQQLQGADFSVGQIVIDDTQARVETKAIRADRSESNFTTYLVKQDHRWWIDYRLTRYSLSQNIFNGLFDSLKAIGEDLNRQMEQQLPEIEQEVESFGRDLKKQLDQLGKELEDALRRPDRKKDDPYRDSI